MNRIIQLPPLPDRPKEGHKGLFGKIVVVGGCETMIGAPVLAGTAALRMGSGLVQLAVQENILSPALSITPELIGLGLGSKLRSEDRMKLQFSKPDVFVVGPGWGNPIKRVKSLQFICELARACIFDADALNAFFMSKTMWWKWIKAPSILTPHPGEMKRLCVLLDKKERLKFSEFPTDDDGRIELAMLASRTFKQIVVLKGHRTVVTDGEKIYVNSTGDSSLAKAGTGDVLSGMIGSLLGQKMNPFDAACAGVWIHGKAGEIAGKKLGSRSVLARDVIDSLSQAVMDYQSQ